MDSKTLEKLSERSYCKDFQRLGLGVLNGTNNKNKSEGFRISSVNSAYSICRSYPALLVVPQTINDESIRKICRCHRHGRFPVITWRHPRTKSLLLRASCFHGKGVIGMLKSHPSSTSASSETSVHLEQEKFMTAIVSSTPASTMRASCANDMHDSTLSITSLVMGVGGLDNFPTLTPEVARRSNPLQKAVNSLRSSGGKGGRRVSSNKMDFRMNRGTSNFSDLRWGSLKERRQGSTTSLGSEFSLRTGTRLSDIPDILDATTHTLHRVALYVFGEKALIKGIKAESFPNCDFIPVEFPEVRHVKASFKKLLRACLQGILQLSGAIVDLMDVQGSSVMICLEDGWDVTTQVTSLAELCLDPYYRTFEGFRTLIEKEWLAFGHRFTHRSNHTAATLASGFAPIFLQFLDAVHQIHKQFPLSFDECERAEVGWLLEDRCTRYRGLDGGSDEETGFSLKTNSLNNSSINGPSFWDYVDKLWARSPIFYNFWYRPTSEDGVLRPYSNISNLAIWDYYFEEELAHGPSYDLELVAMERQREEESEAADGSSNLSSRRIINTCYDSILTVQSDFFTQILETIHNSETELGLLPQKWLMLWEKMEIPGTDSLTRQSSFTTQMVRSHGRSIHKRSTIEILVRGKMVGEATQPQVYSHPHRFEKYNYTTPTYCDYCSHVLWGLVKTGMRCIDCGYNCHEKCLEQVPKNCTKYKSVSDSGAVSATVSKNSAESSSVTSSVTALQSRALLKGWKQRWFVLDSIKHQLRYYDAMEDSHSKGLIDLAEVISVNPAMSVQGAPKKADEKAFLM
ncbi:myotubularin-related protein 5 [Caerostris extrusa]|uniref:Myotubularin-related protein 5 n=1 Tax=Caerostris extrusa TaxID=172846 RepID=A0AAV4VWR7_CAEEX|nr:myotubularin-related protein 5 [Caerostris extrusa]